MSKHHKGLSKVMGEIIAPLISGIIDPEHFGVATVTHVHISPDFDYADVYISVFLHKDELKYVLRENVYNIQQIVNKKIARKKVPKIRFFVDDTGQMAERLESYLKEE